MGNDGKFSLLVQAAIFTANLREVTDYLDTMEHSLRGKQDEIDTRIEEQTRQMGLKDTQYAVDHNSIDVIRLYATVPKYLYNSFIVSWYSFMEDHLQRFCEAYKEYKHLTLGYKDLKDKGIHQTKSYLDKLAKIQLSKPKWDELGRIAKIRNVLVHKSGRFSPDEINSLKQYLQRHKLLDESRNDYSPNDEFCVYLLTFAEKFFLDIYFEVGISSSKENFKRVVNLGDSE